MNIDQRIAGRFEELRKLGERMLSTRRSPAVGHITSDFVDVQVANQWFTSALNLISAVFGRDSEYYRRIDVQFVNYPKHPQAIQAFGAFISAEDEYNREGIFNVRRLVEAEIFDDFLEQAKHLLDLGYAAPAAVIAGCVLEDALRKLCAQKSIHLAPKPKLDTMNAELAKAGVYNRLLQKRITALADIRNSAAHGKWSEFTDEDVRAMVSEIRGFMERHFA